MIKLCAIFGLIDYNRTLNAKQRQRLLRVLSEECEERGTDATGYAFNHNGKLTIFNLDRQLDMLQKYGVDFIYNEKMTGTKRNRPELEKLLERLTEGDTVVVESLSRLGRSTKDLIWLMETFNAKGVNLVSLKESIDTTTSTGKLLFTLMSALAQFERDVLADRTKEGLAAARARGRKGGRRPVNEEAVRKAVKLYNTKQYTVREITELTGVKKTTLYKNLHK